MAAPSWFRCLALDYGDEQRAMPQTPTTSRSGKRGRSNIGHDTSTTTTLPDDTLVEIFSRLPSKSVGRFRCLSRSWAATLTSAPFVDLHLHQANHRLKPKLFSTTVHLDDPDNKRPVKVVTKPCGGLVLLHRTPHDGYYVCNPSTGNLLRLPDIEGRGRRGCISFGLGYSPATMEYKVVRLFASYYKSPLRFEVFTLDVSPHWRALAQKLPSGAVGLPALYCDGYLYFHVKRKIGNSIVDSIVTFDVVEETLGSLTVPPAAQDNNAGSMVLAVLDRCVCLCYRRSVVDPDCCVWIWRLACREAGRWEKLYGIMQPQTADLMHLRWVSPLEIYRAGNGQKKIFFATAERLLAFDFEINIGGTPKILEITGNCSTETVIQIRSDTVGLLEESLVSIGRTSEEIIYSSPRRKAWSDVLKWMPTRSVVTLMCVCKEWHALINSDRFMQTHLLHANLGKSHKIKLVHGHPLSDLSYHTLEFSEREQVQHQMMPFLLDTTWGPRIVCSKPCHSLVLVTYTNVDLDRSCIHYICNPSRECSNRVDQRGEGDSTASIGLGYDLRTNKHVLVRIVCYKNRFGDYKLESHVQVQVKDTTSWISISPPPKPVADMQPVYAHGKLYWKVDAARFELLEFDVGTQEFEVLRGPRCNRDGITSIIEFQGNLCILCSDRRANAIDVWTLLEGGFWSIGYRIELGESKHMYPSYQTTLLDVDPKDGRILLSTGRALGYYDPKTRTVQSIYHLGQRLSFSMKFAPVLCQETLIRPWT